MKYAVIGDIHANYQALEAVLEKAAEEGVERFICLGDIVGYNAEPSACLERIRELEPDVIVRGNHDEYVSSGEELLGFNPQAANVVEWTREQLTPQQREWLASLAYQKNLDSKVTVVHATLDMPAHWGYIFDKWHATSSFVYQYTQICFVGHTHVPVAFDKFMQISTLNYDEITIEPGHKYLINVGSVGQPRDGDPRAAFAVYDDAEKMVKKVRVPYDLDKCQQLIREAELPEKCAMRLAEGR
ncbi:MAG: metallophosphoesterase family protein [Verrucomicrobiota bacterium]